MDSSTSVPTLLKPRFIGMLPWASHQRDPPRRQYGSLRASIEGDISDPGTDRGSRIAAQPRGRRSEEWAWQ